MPVDASISLTVSLAVVRDPDVGTIRRHPIGAAADRDRVDDRAGRRIDLTDRTVAEFATQTWVPSDDTPSGPLPTVIVLTTAAADAEDTPIASQRPASTASAPSDRTILITTALPLIWRSRLSPQPRFSPLPVDERSIRKTSCQASRGPRRSLGRLRARSPRAVPTRIESCRAVTRVGVIARHPWPVLGSGRGAPFSLTDRGESRSRKYHPARDPTLPSLLLGQSRCHLALDSLWRVGTPRAQARRPVASDHTPGRGGLSMIRSSPPGGSIEPGLAHSRSARASVSPASQLALEPTNATVSVTRALAAAHQQHPVTAAADDRSALPDLAELTIELATSGSAASQPPHERLATKRAVWSTLSESYGSIELRQRGQPQLIERRA